MWAEDAVTHFLLFLGRLHSLCPDVFFKLSFQSFSDAWNSLCMHQTFVWCHNVMREDTKGRNDPVKENKWLSINIKCDSFLGDVCLEEVLDRKVIRSKGTKPFVQECFRQKRIDANRRGWSWQALPILQLCHVGGKAFYLGSWHIKPAVGCWLTFMYDHYDLQISFLMHQLYCPLLTDIHSCLGVRKQQHRGRLCITVLFLSVMITLDQLSAALLSLTFPCQGVW